MNPSCFKLWRGWRPPSLPSGPGSGSGVVKAQRLLVSCWAPAAKPQVQTGTRFPQENGTCPLLRAPGRPPPAPLHWRSLWRPLCSTLTVPERTPALLTTVPTTKPHDENTPTSHVCAPEFSSVLGLQARLQQTSPPPHPQATPHGTAAEPQSPPEVMAGTLTDATGRGFDRGVSGRKV